ncbi:hypothetical protein BJ875DRAFT_524797 [Amylocarpus encephaloides]|uniref:Chromo domain-containing protein n=1 Tax=Amylocarpus encephaloides TaxID=45428 RepID=A0A9P7Y881_9HELO|nr:hypothetical protein BJ875DRAFT_524797 [Amylocarpus encephaloides]
MSPYHLSPFVAQTVGKLSRAVDQTGTHLQVDRGGGCMAGRDYDSIKLGAASLAKWSEASIPQANYDPIQVRAHGRNFNAADKLQDLEDTRDNQSGATLAPSPDVAHQNATASSRGAMYESDRIPVRGYLTLTAEESRVQYSFTFSQDLGERQDAADSSAFQQDTPAADPGQQWEIRKIIGQKVVGREKYYRVEWKDTWMPESEMVGAKELVYAFIAKNGSGISGRKRFRNQCVSTIEQSDCQDMEAPKKRCGRPRKQT